jgi:hypothetical protein
VMRSTGILECADLSALCFRTGSGSDRIST